MNKYILRKQAEQQLLQARAARSNSLWDPEIFWAVVSVMLPACLAIYLVLCVFFDGIYQILDRAGFFPVACSWVGC